MLYTIGDSFTYGAELANPEQDAWPVLVARKANMKLLNEGEPGVGNEYIIKKTILAVSKHKPDLVIIGWTSCSRQEFADYVGVFDIWPTHNRRRFKNAEQRHRLPLIDYITRYNNDLHEYRRWLRQIVLLQSFLQVNNQKYLMLSTHDNQHRFGRFWTLCQDYYDLIDHTKFVGWPNDGMVEWAFKTPHGPGGHFLEEGHQKVANEIIPYI